HQGPRQGQEKVPTKKTKKRAKKRCQEPIKIVFIGSWHLFRTGTFSGAPFPDARAGFDGYWIVTLNDRQVEVYTVPSGPVPAPKFGQRVDYRVGESVSLLLGRTIQVQVAVQDLLP